MQPHFLACFETAVIDYLQGGQREIVLGVDDQLLARAESEGTSRRIPRDDVAALAVAALFSGAAKNRCAAYTPSSKYTYST